MAVFYAWPGAAVDHPLEWPDCGFQEIQKPRERYAIIDRQKLAELASVADQDSLGACRIIGIFAQIEANSKKLPEAYTEYSEDNFFEFNEDMGKKGIIRQAPSREP